MLDKSSKPRSNKGDTESQEASDFMRLLAHIEENPWHYVAGGAFILFCLVAGFLFRLERTVAEERVVTQYAEAMLQEDLELRLEALEEVAERSGQWGEEAQYMIGETALRQRDYERAEAAFQNLLDRNADSEFAPQAQEGIAFIAENRGDLEEALAGYQEVVDRWGNSFISRRQPFHIGRVLEAQDNIDEAIASYEQQEELFPESFVAMRAEGALNELRQEYPDYFPEEEEAEETEAAAADPMAPAATPAPPTAPEAAPTAPPVDEEMMDEAVEALPSELVDAPEAPQPMEMPVPAENEAAPVADTPADEPVEPDTTDADAEAGDESEVTEEAAEETEE